jgi:hypothetical protein
LACLRKAVEKGDKDAQAMLDDLLEQSEYQNTSNAGGQYTSQPPKKSGCYLATAVYGSYDCPEVWTLRRFRDQRLATVWYGRLFICVYYALSPSAVKAFGGNKWFNLFVKSWLDKLVVRLQSQGIENTRYHDLL